MLALRRIEPHRITNEQLFDYPDATVYQTREWVSFVAECHGAEPVRAELKDGAATVGYFTGLIIRPLGLPILGSPFPGWTTQYMGFCTQPGVPRAAALAALPTFAFNDLGCVYFEVGDPKMTAADGLASSLDNEPFPTYETDLRQDESLIYATMREDVRWSIRKAKRLGTVVAPPRDHDEFAASYYLQLQDVFRKHGLVPTYGADRVRSLIRWLYPTGHLLLLEARTADGLSIATGIYVGFRQHAQFWGNASLRSGQKWRPNELMHWQAMRYWKAKGAEVFDWGGLGDYKEKFGCIRTAPPRFVKTRIPGIRLAKRLVRRAYEVRGLLAALRTRARPRDRVT